MSPGRWAAVLWLQVAVLGCHQYFRPNHPVRVSDGRTTVEVRAVDFRASDVEVALSGPRPDAAIDGAWLFATAAPDGAPCARQMATRRIRPSAPAGPGTTWSAHFSSDLTEVLKSPSTLETRLAAHGEPARCLSIPIGPRAGTIDFMVSFARWLPNGGANVLGFTVGVN